MAKFISVLILEDQSDDAELMVRQLHRSGFAPDWQRVESQPDYEVALSQAATASSALDLILADYRLPQFNALRALQLLQARGLDIPFIVVTGSINEEVAVECIKQGAADYVLKDHLQRLGPAVEHALAQKQLRETKRQAEQERERLIEELDAFAHMVAHDLKNPLAVMTGTAQVLEDNCSEMPAVEFKTCLQTIVRMGDKMNNIIDELLLLARVRRQEIEPQPLDMSGLVAEARQRLSQMIITSRTEIITPPTWPAALGHGPWIEAVWVNYLSNAIKYGGHPPRVELGATEQADGQVCFWVRDNGPGLNPVEQARLFTPFTRLKGVQGPGYGLGLSIVQRIVEKLGGQVGVESNGVAGQGSTFSFTLPRVAGGREDKIDEVAFYHHREIDPGPGALCVAGAAGGGCFSLF